MVLLVRLMIMLIVMFDIMLVTSVASDDTTINDGEGASATEQQVMER